MGEAACMVSARALPPPLVATSATRPVAASALSLPAGRPTAASSVSASAHQCHVASAPCTPSARSCPGWDRWPKTPSRRPSLRPHRECSRRRSTRATVAQWSQCPRCVVPRNRPLRARLLLCCLPFAPLVVGVAALALVQRRRLAISLALRPLSAPCSLWRSTMRQNGRARMVAAACSCPQQPTKGVETRGCRNEEETYECLTYLKGHEQKAQRLLESRAGAVRSSGAVLSFAATGFGGLESLTAMWAAFTNKNTMTNEKKTDKNEQNTPRKNDHDKLVKSIKEKMGERGDDGRAYADERSGAGAACAAGMGAAPPTSFVAACGIDPSIVVSAAAVSATSGMGAAVLAFAG